MIMIVRIPEDIEIKDFNAIFFCSTKDPKSIINLIEDIDLDDIIHDYGDNDIDLTDPFKFKKIFFN